jgi:hypothetical protein
MLLDALLKARQEAGLNHELIRCNPNSGMGSKESDKLANWLSTQQP